MEILGLTLLGPLTVTRNGDPAPDFVSRKAQALLAYLVLDSARAHARDELAALLWPDYPEESARASLRSTLANVRHVIGDREADPPHLLITRESVQFNRAGTHVLDVAMLDAPPELTTETVGQLETILTRASAPLLAGFSLPDSPPFEEWLLLRREAYVRRVAALWGALVRYHEACGDVAASLAAARRWEERDPWDEDAHRQIMRLLALQGHRGQAMAQFERCRDVLVRELGVEPSDATMALAEQIRQGAVTSATVTDVQAAAAASGVVTSAPTSAAPGRTPHHVPKLLTPTVGRSQELTMLAELFGDREQRLVTIVGPGGMGKTHLAQEFAARHEGRYRDGAAMVALAGVQAVDGVAAAVAHALNLSVDERVPIDRQVQDYLAARRMLLVLDNVEHLPAAVPTVEAWLAAAPDLVVLATSRLRLQAQGEQLFPLGGLPVGPAMPVKFGAGIKDNGDDSVGHAHIGADFNSDFNAEFHTAGDTDGDAVAFFLQCAQRVRPRRRLDHDHPELEHVRRICRLVGGMPLALMLAASWSASLSFQEIADELTQGLDLLQSDDRAFAPRHQNIANVFEQAWTMLSADEQRVLVRVAVFRGGFTREAAAAVADASLAQLRGLTGKFLLSRSAEGRSPHQGRFGMHELLRQFSLDKLAVATGDRDEAHARHAAFFVHFPAQREPDIKGPRQMEAVREIDAEIENITAAWYWVCANDVSMLSPAAVHGLGRFYAWQGRYREGAQAMDTCRQSVAPPATAALPAESVRLLAAACRWQAHFYGLLGRRESADQTLALGLASVKSLQKVDADSGVLRALLLGEQGLQVQNHEDRIALLTEAVTLLRTTPLQWELADALCRLGSTLASRPGTAEAGRAALDESRQLLEKLEDRWSLCDVLRHISFSAMLRGDHERGEATARHALAIARELGSEVWVVRSMRILGYVLLFAGKFEEALAHAYAAMDIMHSVGGRSLTLYGEVLIGNVLLYLGRNDEALQSLQAVLAGGLDGNNDSMSHVLWRRADAYLAQGNCDEAGRDLRLSVDMHRQGGWTGRLHDVLTSVGYLAFALGNEQLLRASLAECAAAAGPDRLWLTTTRSIVLAALAALAEGRLERAVELYALAETERHVVASPFYTEVAGRHVRSAATQLAPEVVASAAQRGRQLNRWTTVEAIAREYTGALAPDTAEQP